MNLRELLVKIGVDDSGTTEKLDKIDDSTNKVRQSLLSLGDVLAGLGIGVALQRVAALADGLQNLQSRIDAAAGSHIDGLFETLSQHASDARMDVEAYTDSWAKFESGMRRLGYDVEATTTLTDTLSAAFRVNGTEAQTAAGALFQLTQSIGSGSVQMEELNSFMDASPDLYVAVAESIGGTTTAFKKMVSDGKVSSKMLADAIMAQNKRIMEQLRKMPLTLGDVWTQVKNDAKTAFKQMVVDTKILQDAAADLKAWWGEAREGWQEFVKSMGGARNVAASIQNLLTPLAALLGILTGFKALALLTSPVGAVLALATAIGLLYDDYMVWKEGGTSLIDWREWQTTLTEAGNLVTDLTNDVNGLIKATKDLLGVDVSKWTLKGEVEDLIHQVHTLTASIQGVVDTIKNLSDGDLEGAWKAAQRAWKGQTWEQQQQEESDRRSREASGLPPAEASQFQKFADSPIGKMISFPADAVVDAFNWGRNKLSGPAAPQSVDVNPYPDNVQPDIPGGAPTGFGAPPAIPTPIVNVSPIAPVVSPIAPIDQYRDPLPPRSSFAGRNGGAGAENVDNRVTNNDNKTINQTFNNTINYTGTDQNIGQALLEKMQMQHAQGMRDVAGSK